MGALLVMIRYVNDYRGTDQMALHLVHLNHLDLAQIFFLYSKLMLHYANLLEVHHTNLRTL